MLEHVRSAAGRGAWRWPPDREDHRRLFLVTTLATVVLAFGARLLPVSLGGGLGTIGGYDDGVYYTAATALAHGRLPYRDFLLLHPPGVLLVLAPFGWLGSHTSDATGFAVARVAFMIIGATNAALVALVLRRFGLAAAVAGGVFYAVFYPAIYAERSTLLEPLGTLSILVALVLLSRAGPHTRNRLLLAGAVLGAGVAVKIWYVVAVLVIVAAQSGRGRWRVLGGAAASAAVICLPFFAAAPGAMVRYVLSDQIGRLNAPVSVPERLESIVGLDGISARDAASSTAIHLSLLVALAVFTCCAVIAVTQRGARVFVVLLVAHGALLLASPSYYQHYSTLTATPLALVVGVAVGSVVRSAPVTSPRRPLLALAALAAFLVYGASGIVHPLGTPFPGSALRPAAARVKGCIVADDPAALVEMNVLTQDLRRRCTLWPDVTGYTYDVAKPRTRAQVHRVENSVWQQIVRRYLTSGSAVILVRPATGLSGRTLARVKSGKVLARADGYVLRRTPR